MSSDGGDPVTLIDFTASVPRYSPDGTMIAFEFENEPGKSQLGIMGADGGARIKTFEVPPTANFRNGLRWTPDGKSVTYRDWGDGIGTGNSGRRTDKVDRAAERKGLHLCMVTRRQEFCLYSCH